MMLDSDLFKLDFYTKSLHRDFARESINVGNSQTNQKSVRLNKQYKNPGLFPRKFEEWPDSFDVRIVGEDLVIKRIDNPGGWGANLIVDIEYDRCESPQPQAKNLKIPRVIYQTFKSRLVPKGMYDSVNSWKELNPGYEHYFYGDEECLDFLKKYYDKDVVESYLSLIPGAFKADLWRCCVLFEKGGVYVDSDMICLLPLDNFLNPDDEFVVARDDPMSKSYLYNAFIACTPKHKFIQKQIDSIVENVKARKSVFYLDVSGPGLLGKSVNFCLNRSSNHEFALGPQSINNFNFNIILHDWSCKSIIVGNDKIIYTEYDSKNKEMDSLNISTYYSMYQKGLVYQRIPRNIFYTTEDCFYINGYMVESFKHKNSNWKLQYYTAEQRSEFFKQNKDELASLLGLDASSFYDSLKSGVEKADFWRYCVVYLKGGVYTDSDTYCNRPLDSWISGHDLILGIEGNLSYQYAKSFGMDVVGKRIGEDKLISVGNWSFAAEPKHPFFKDLILDICNNPCEGVLVNTGPGRLTKHAFEYFKGCNFLDLDNNDLTKGLSILFSINRFGSNQAHSNSYKSSNIFEDSNKDVYIVHLFDGSWRSIPNKQIKKYPCRLGVSHNISIKNTSSGYFGISRLDKDTSRTIFPKKIGDCRELLKLTFDKELNLVSEEEHHILGYEKPAKFEDFRIFSFSGKDYCCVSYIDEQFNTRVCILDENYQFLGDVKIGERLAKSPFTEGRVWEKNWLFFEHNNELYFIYSTLPRYVVYKCKDFKSLLFEKFIDVAWPIKDTIPSKEFYSTSNALVGGSTNPIFLKDKNLYLYFVHTKIYNERKYNHYAIVLDKNLSPIKLCAKPIISKYVGYSLFFVMSVLEQENYLVFSGGLEDNTNWIWEISKSYVFKTIGI